MNNSEGDILLYSTIDGGEINIENNFLEMTGGFETSIYLCLFGGNELDNGTESTKKYQYWANILDQNEPDKQLRSRTQNILRGLPATSANLLRLEEAIKQDMKLFFNLGIIDTLNINTRIPEKNKVNIIIEGLKDKTQLFNIKYIKNWLVNLQ